MCATLRACNTWGVLCKQPRPLRLGPVWASRALSHDSFVLFCCCGTPAAQVFVKGLLDRYKVQPEVFRREEYKVGWGRGPAGRAPGLWPSRRRWWSRNRSCN